MCCSLGESQQVASGKVDSSEGSSPNFSVLIHKVILLRNNGQRDRACRMTNRTAYTMAISKKIARAKDLGFRSKGMTSCCMLKIAAASATG